VLDVDDLAVLLDHDLDRDSTRRRPHPTHEPRAHWAEATHPFLVTRSPCNDPKTRSSALHQQQVTDELSRLRSDTTVHRGRITKQGSRLVRWAAVEAVQRVPSHTRLGRRRDRVGARRGHNIGVVAAARDLVTLVFYGLRDHHIRCLRPSAAGAA
jgi:hypothetical protein